MSKITVTTIAGLTSGGDANKVKIESGDDLEVVSGDLTVDTSTLKVDSSNNRVGIGTASPSSRIHIGDSGNAGEEAIQFSNNAVQGFIGIEGSSGNRFLGSAVNNMFIGTTAADGLELATNNNVRMTIDSSGRVTMPSQPVFFATAEANIPLSNSYSELTAFSNGQVNVGTHYNTSNGRFTAPIAGTYQFAVASIGNQNADVYRFRPYKNGSSLNNYELRIQTEGGAYGTNGEFCFIVTLAVNDYISIFGYSDGSTNAYGDTNYRYSYFRGHLMS